MNIEECHKILSDTVETPFSRPVGATCVLYVCTPLTTFSPGPDFAGTFTSLDLISHQGMIV